MLAERAPRGCDNMGELTPRERSRKKPKTPRLVRGAPIVRRTLDATLAELGHAGYAGLRIDDVARRANVNKTTIYRRWPTKEDLVRAALLSLAERTGGLSIPDTGTLHGDLTELVRQKVRFARSPEGSAIVRIVEAGDPGLVGIVQSLRAARDVIRRTILERAKARGTLRAEVDVVLFMDVMQLACDHARSKSGRVDSRFVNGLIDLLLHGAGKPRASNSKLRSTR